MGEVLSNGTTLYFGRDPDFLRVYDKVLIREPPMELAGINQAVYQLRADLWRVYYTISEMPAFPDAEDHILRSNRSLRPDEVHMEGKPRLSTGAAHSAGRAIYRQRQDSADSRGSH